jgi:hypothetical protein
MAVEIARFAECGAETVYEYGKFGIATVRGYPYAAKRVCQDRVEQRYARRLLCIICPWSDFDDCA